MFNYQRRIVCLVVFFFVHEIACCRVSTATEQKSLFLVFFCRLSHIIPNANES